MPELITTENLLNTAKKRLILNKQYKEDTKFLSYFENLTQLHQRNLETEAIAATNTRKHFGIYHTPYVIAKLITKNTLTGIHDKTYFLKAKFLEPCMGAGIFIIAYLDHLLETFSDWTDEELQTVINHCYGADIDKKAVRLFQEFFPTYIQNKYGKAIQLRNENFYIGDLLFKTDENGTIEKTDPKQLFNANTGFDLILTNPPYKLLKANSNKYGNSEYANEVKQLIQFIKANNTYPYNSGTLNLYRLFVEEIFENYTKTDARIGLLIPQTFLNDKQSERLRKRVFTSSQIQKISILAEKNDFFPDITQSFCFFSAFKGMNTSNILLQPNITKKSELNTKFTPINTELIAGLSDSFPIIHEEAIGWRIIDKLQKHPKIKELPYLINARGELDLTLNKDYITNTNTKYRLLRGANIKAFFTTKNEEFVKTQFVGAINGKQEYIEKERIICQQISNMASLIRLKCAKLSDTQILANSCNFITFKDSLIKPQFSLNYLLGILNSKLLDWRFRLTSSNNHINNYELAELPIAIPSNKQLENIEVIVKMIMQKGNNEELQYELDDMVYNLYGLDKIEIDYINNKYLK